MTPHITEQLFYSLSSTKSPENLLGACLFLFGLPLKAQYSQKESFPPLHQAVLENDTEKAKTIIQKATLDFEKESILTSKPSPFDEKSSNNATPMMLASYIGNLERKN